MSADLIARMELYGAMVRSNRFSRAALQVAFVLLYQHLNGHTGRCDPAVPTLASETGLTPRGVNKALAELRESGWWQITQGGGRSRTNSYSPNPETPNRGSGFNDRNLEQPFTVSDPKTLNGCSRNPEPSFRGTSKNQEESSLRSDSGARRAPRSSLDSATGDEPAKVGLSSEIRAHDKPAISRKGSAKAHRAPARGNGLAGLFDEFWSAYPSRGDHANPKDPARQKFAAAVKAGADPQSIIAGARGYAACMRRKGDLGTRFVCQATTFLQQRRWEEYLDAPGPERLRAGMN
jgi:hypothetical protein